MRASSEPEFGALREGGGTRDEAGSTVAESLVVLYQVGTHQIRRRWRAARSSTSQGRAEPVCARITGLNREVSKAEPKYSSETLKVRSEYPSQHFRRLIPDIVCMYRY